MGNIEQKRLVESIATSSSVQSILTQTAVKMARVLSASLIQLCKEISRSSVEGVSNVFIRIEIKTQNVNIQPHAKRMRKIMKTMQEDIQEAEIVDRKKWMMETNKKSKWYVCSAQRARSLFL